MMTLRSYLTVVSVPLLIVAVLSMSLFTMIYGVAWYTIPEGIAWLTATALAGFPIINWIERWAAKDSKNLMLRRKKYVRKFKAAPTSQVDEEELVEDEITEEV